MTTRCSGPTRVGNGILFNLTVVGASPCPLQNVIRYATPIPPSIEIERNATATPYACPCHAAFSSCGIAIIAVCICTHRLCFRVHARDLARYGHQCVAFHHPNIGARLLHRHCRIPTRSRTVYPMAASVPFGTARPGRCARRRASSI
jgi:hypothetical protein